MQPKSATIKNSVTVIQLASGDLWAGAEVQLFTLSKSLQRHPQVNLHVILLNKGKLEAELKKQRISTYVYDESRLSSIQIFKKLSALCKQLRPDILHTHRQKENVIGSLACLFSDSCRSLRTIHGSNEHTLTLKSVIQNALDIFCGNFLQKRVVSVTNELTGKLKSIYPLKVVTIPNGVDIDSIKAASQAPSMLKSNDEELSVGFFGRLVPVKRVDLIIDIAEALVARAKNVHFYIAGTGPEEDKIRSLIINRDLSEHITLLSHLDNPYPILKQMDCVLLTSDHEGSPMILLEALSLGTYIIAHNTGEIGNYLSQPTLGQAIDSQNPTDYSKALESLIEEKQSRDRKAGPKYIIEKYSNEIMANKYLSTYLDICKHKPKLGTH
ncbi:MAG TPA: glycosyltransferase [Gammaproteobacteria bacterium]|nr:glycosyltransferase [Gammaproteobacteria bacterium]